MPASPRSRDQATDPSPDPAGVDGEIVILLPVFNDWPALRLLLDDLDATLARGGRRARILLVDDGSTTPAGDDFLGSGFEALRRVDLVELRRNLGHQRAIAIGLAYIEACIPCRVVVLMDSDGEDAPSDVPRLLDQYEREGGRKIIFAERTRRSESLTFQAFYRLYKLLHYVLTGYTVRVGNFSVIPRERLASLVVVSELWNHYAAAAFRSRQPFDTLPTQRASRLSGRSKMDFTRLVVHGLSALSIYSDIIGVRLLVATTGLILLASAGLVVTAFIRLATPLAIPGWATNVFGLLLVILLQAVMFSILFILMILGGRQDSAFLPRRDYAHYVGATRTIYRHDRVGQLS